MPFVASVETHLPCWGLCLWWGAGGDALGQAQGGT